MSIRDLPDLSPVPEGARALRVLSRDTSVVWESESSGPDDDPLLPFLGGSLFFRSPRTTYLSLDPRSPGPNLD